MFGAAVARPHDGGSARFIDRPAASPPRAGSATHSTATCSYTTRTCSVPALWLRRRSLAGDDAMLERALRAARVTIESQRADGSWPYGRRADLEWCDNFHTAYNLDGLLSVWLASGDEQVEESLRRGCEYWVPAFFEADGAPRYFDRTARAVRRTQCGYRDRCCIKACGVRVRHRRSRARAVAEWTREHLVAPDGTTYYQWSPRRVDRRHFVRWGDAHVALGSGRFCARRRRAAAARGARSPRQHADEQGADLRGLAGSARHGADRRSVRGAVEERRPVQHVVLNARRSF